MAHAFIEIVTNTVLFVVCCRAGDRTHGVDQLLAANRHAGAGATRPRSPADRRRERHSETCDPVTTASAYGADANPLCKYRLILI